MIVIDPGCAHTLETRWPELGVEAPTSVTTLVEHLYENRDAIAILLHGAIALLLVVIILAMILLGAIVLAIVGVVVGRMRGRTTVLESRMRVTRSNRCGCKPSCRKLGRRLLPPRGR